LGRKLSIIIVKPPIAFLPSARSLTPELVAEVFTNERMGIQTPRIMRIFGSEESSPS